MPHKSAEQLKQKTAALKKKLTEKAASMDPVKVRKAKKTIRRDLRKKGMRALVRPTQPFHQADMRKRVAYFFNFVEIAGKCFVEFLK